MRRTRPRLGGTLRESRAHRSAQAIPRDPTHIPRCGASDPLRDATLDPMAWDRGWQRRSRWWGDAGAVLLVGLAVLWAPWSLAEASAGRDSAPDRGGASDPQAPEYRVGTIAKDAVLSRVDPDVFDALAERASVRVIAVFETAPGEATGAPPAAARAALAGHGFRSKAPFTRLPLLAGSVESPSALERLASQPGVLRVGLDLPVQAQLAESLPLVGLDTLHDSFGATGQGGLVAVVDTGIDLDHPDLVDAIVGEQCFCDDGLAGTFGCCPNGRDTQSGAGAGQDDHGHGTRVAGIVTSSGAYAEVGGAPDAGLLAVKVLSSSGGGYSSDVVAGLDWVLANHPETDVVNVSLGGGLYAGDCDMADASTIAYATAIDLLYAAGITVVAGAGNNRSATSMIAPACVSTAVSVGAVFDADVGSWSQFGCTDATTQPDQVACWSNGSATTDLVAPGARITTSTLDSTISTRQGTSYATPHVAACAAVLARAHPGLPLEDLLDALTQSPTVVVDPKNGLAFPRLDCLAAHLTLLPHVPTVGPGPGRFLLLALVVGVVGMAGIAGRARTHRSAP